MKRLVIMVSGFVIAGIYAAVMYSVYGNLNWGSEAYKSVPWFEPVFWIIVASGPVILVILDMFCSMRKELKCCVHLMDT